MSKEHAVEAHNESESDNAAAVSFAHNHRRWMAISAVTGLAFFLVANFTDLFAGLNVISGVMQIGINTFVFVTWLRGYRASYGRERLVAFFGVIAPPILAGITLYRIILPFFSSLF